VNCTLENFTENEYLLKIGNNRPLIVTKKELKDIEFLIRTIIADEDEGSYATVTRTPTSPCVNGMSYAGKEK
jgi:hypothetical protein